MRRLSEWHNVNEHNHDGLTGETRPLARTHHQAWGTSGVSGRLCSSFAQHVAEKSRNLRPKRLYRFVDDFCKRYGCPSARQCHTDSFNGFDTCVFDGAKGHSDSRRWAGRPALHRRVTMQRFRPSRSRPACIREQLRVSHLSPNF